MEQKRGWRSLLIEPKYQLKFVAWFSLHGLVVAIFYIALMRYFVRNTLVTLIDMAEVSAHNKQVLVANFDHLIFEAVIATLLFSVLCAVGGLLFSHHTARPIHRLKQLFVEVRDGDLEARAKMKEGDHWGETADLFNDMMTSLQSRSKKE